MMKIRRYKNVISEFLGELVSTWILLSFGTGVVAQTVLSRNSAGSMLSINIGWGAGVTLGILAAGQISGAHMNPAVTVAQAVWKNFPWKKVPHYIVAQYLGAFLGGATTLVTYWESIQLYSGDHLQVSGENGTAMIFTTFPAEGVSNVGGAVDQIVGTGLMMVCLSAIGLPKNSHVSRSLAPFLAGLVILTIGVAFGYNTGYALNPARDFSPRFLLFISGWGSQVFKEHDYWFWIPIVATHVGAILGIGVYRLSVEFWLHEEDVEPEADDLSKTTDKLRNLDDSGKTQLSV